MCGIVGMVGRQPVVSHLITGLGRLEYRGYDSAGLAVVGSGGIERRRATGRVSRLGRLIETDPVEGHAGIAHTRWATHGGPSERNAHPHATSRVAVVHNGIIENHRELRAELQAGGARFESDTDTEVIPHLISHYLTLGLTPVDAIRAAAARLHGQFAFAAVFADKPGLIIAARRGSPLSIGHQDGRSLVASDPVAFSGLADVASHLEDGDLAVLEPGRVTITDSLGREVQRRRETVPDATAVELGAYKHHMVREMWEQPEVALRVLQSLDGPDGHLHLPHAAKALLDAKRIIFLGAGTSLHAGLVARHWFEQHLGIPVEAEIASEFRYREPPLDAGTLCIAMSQSGETADTLGALRYAASAGARTLALVNVSTSTMAREASSFLPLLAGPEIGVASTKAFTAQLTLLAGLSVAAGRARGRLTDDARDVLEAALVAVPAALTRALALEHAIDGAAQAASDVGAAFFLGRGVALALAAEGALKTKEIAYVRAEGYGAGELKHGPIALVEPGLPVFAVLPPDALAPKTLSNLEEVAARGARVFVVTDESLAPKLGKLVEQAFVLPKMHPLTFALAAIVPMQWLAYRAATLRGHDVDRPRNLAKSVTVE